MLPAAEDSGGEPGPAGGGWAGVRPGGRPGRLLGGGGQLQVASDQDPLPHRPGPPQPGRQGSTYTPVLGIRDIFVRIRIGGSVSLTVMDPVPTPFFIDFKDAKKYLFSSYFSL